MAERCSALDGDSVARIASYLVVAQEIVMHPTTDHNRRASGFELRFRSIPKPGSGYAFPCDASGSVDLDTLSETGRSHYFFARTLVGSEFYMPKVIATAASWAAPQGHR
jgi:hypothetical protein